MKKYEIFAGVNGAGKSTLYATKHVSAKEYRVNTDEILRNLGDWRDTSLLAKAGKEAVIRIKEYFEKECSFNQETTLCGHSILRNIKKAKELGYVVEMHYVGVESVELAKKRIAHRVEHGGHGVPDADVERRYEESLANLYSIAPFCDLVDLYDNTQVFRRFAIIRKGEIVRLSASVPKWFDEGLLKKGLLMKQ